MLQIQPDKLEAFNQRVRDDNRQLSYRIRINEKEVPLKQIMSNLTITTDGGFEEYSIGYALTSILEFTTSKELSLVGASIVDIEVGLGVDQQEVVWTSFQRFYVYDTTIEGLNRKVKCYDYMYRLDNTGYFPSANYTMTQEVCRDMSKQLNLAFTGAVNVAIDSSGLEGRTYKEVLGYLASAMGKNVRISRTNRIEFFGLSETGLLFGPGEYRTPTTNDSNYSITCLEVHYGEQSTNEDGGVTDPGYYRVGTYCSDAKTLVITNPLLKGKQDVATTVLNEIKDLSYSRFDTSYKVADYRLEVGDMVSFLINGVKIKVPILYTKYTLIYNNVNLEIQSPTKSEEKKEHNFKGTLTQKVESLHANVLQVQHVIADKVSVGELKATVAEIERLYATKAEIGELVAGSIVVEELKAQVADIGKAIINKADITDLNVVNATIQSLKADVAEIEDLIADSILAEIIQSGSISSDLLNVKDGFIKDAMISSLSASKIDAGVINTNNVSIQSENGDMLLQGNLLQFKDKNEKVRIQIGQDTTGNYTFTLYDSTGKGVLINQDGIQSSNAIKDGLIVDSKVADNANISGSKLNISSLYDSMNADGSKTLKASKVHLDDKGQTLDVSFKEMTSKTDKLEDSMNTAITDIRVAQGQISQLIQDTTIATTEGTTTIKDAFNSIKNTVDSHTTKIGKVEFTIDNVEARVSSAEQKITPDAIVLTVTNSKTYTDAMTGKVDKKSVISSINQTAESVKINANKIALTGSVVISAINGSSTNSTYISGSKIRAGSIASTDNSLLFDLNNAQIRVNDPSSNRVGMTVRNKIVDTTTYGMSTNAEYSSYVGLGVKNSTSASTYSLYVTCIAQDGLVSGYKKGVNIGDHFHAWYPSYFHSTVNCDGSVYANSHRANNGYFDVLRTYTSPNNSATEIKVYDNINMNHWSILNTEIKNSSMRWDGFPRSTGDYVRFERYNSTSESHMQLCLADDINTYFTIYNKHYQNGNKTIARFKGANGTYSGSADSVKMHLYGTIDLHSWGIINAGSVYGATIRSLSLDIESDTVTVQSSSPVVLNTGDDFSDIEVPTKTQYLTASTTNTINHHGVVVVSDKADYVELPSDFVMCENIHVVATPNKLCRYAIISIDEYGFVIECDEEDVTFSYTVVADKIDVMSLTERKSQVEPIQDVIDGEMEDNKPIAYEDREIEMVEPKPVRAVVD